MSFFDPHGVYVHRTKSTRKGQILQKKPRHILGALSYQDRVEAEKILKSFGLKAVPIVDPTPPTPSQPMQPFLYTFNLTAS